MKLNERDNFALEINSNYNPKSRIKKSNTRFTYTKTNRISTSNEIIEDNYSGFGIDL